MSSALVPANILIVDDTPENLRLLTAILGHTGYEVRPVTSGRQALQTAELAPPDLVLLDITMPEMDGYEVCTRMKAQDRLRDVPIIFITALNEIADKVRAFEVGGVDYITKPFQLEEVQARVKTHLALRKASAELSRSYEQLRGLEKLRDDLVHMVVHDMRSPLFVMLGNLQFLQSNSSLNQEGTEDLLAAIHGAEALNRMANDLLDVSRMENGKMPVQAAVHDLGELARATKAALDRLERGRPIVVEAPGPVPVSCDGALIARVLENLVSNAIKHTPVGSSVSIGVASDHGRAKITVSDQGPGVPPEARQKIFEKFGTVSGTAESRYHSVGLGLAFCKLAVEAHCGTIGVDAEEPQGSRFWFELPVDGRKESKAP